MSSFMRYLASVSQKVLDFSCKWLSAFLAYSLILCPAFVPSLPFRLHTIVAHCLNVSRSGNFKRAD